MARDAAEVYIRQVKPLQSVVGEMPTGTPGNDLFTASKGRQSFTGGAGVDTVSYGNSGTGVYVNLGSGQSTPLLKIMPFGDSITYGIISIGTVKDRDSGGYRPYLWNDIQAQDLAIDYVGSVQSGPLDFPDRDNAGFGGKTINYLNSVDAGLLNTYKPDVVLLMIGTNDTESRTANQMIADLRSLLISIATNAPQTAIFVAGIPPNYDESENAVAQQYNAMIQGLVDELNDTYKVIFVDTSELTLDDVTPPPMDEGAHPTAAGYEKLAGIWLDAIMDSGVFEDERDTLSSIENVTGSNYGDKLVGNAANNVLSGLAGNDQLNGAGGNDTLIGGTGDDHINGGSGNDVIRGGTGRDFLRGGSGADKFDWDKIGDAGLGAKRDQVLDFTHNADKLDLSTIDAKAGTSTNDAFTFIGSNSFSGVAGQLRAKVVHDTTGDYTIVQGDVNGDRVADFEIALVACTATLQASDFVL